MQYIHIYIIIVKHTFHNFPDIIGHRGLFPHCCLNILYVGGPPRAHLEACILTGKAIQTELQWGNDELALPRR